jgi:hypothetical protein
MCWEPSNSSLLVLYKIYKRLLKAIAILGYHGTGRHYEIINLMEVENRIVVTGGAWKERK